MNRMRKALLAACCPIAAIVGCAPTWAAAEAVSAISIAPAIEVLDEAIAQGQGLEQRIREYEDRFYARYNALNEDPDFDVSCEHRYLDRDSIARDASSRQRGCVPMYFLTAERSNDFYNAARVAARGGCRDQPIGFSTTLPDGMGTESQWYGRPLFSACSGPGSVPAAASVPRVDTRLAYVARLRQFKAAIAAALKVDPELRLLASELDALAIEGQESRRRIAEYRMLETAERRCSSGSPMDRASNSCREK